MFTADESPIYLWVYELDWDPIGFDDGFAFAAMARSLMKDWNALDLFTASVTVPALNFVSRSEVYGMGVLTPQRFGIGWDEAGGRAIADRDRTNRDSKHPSGSRPVEFGANAPLLMWFSEEGADMTFTLFLPLFLDCVGSGQQVDVESLEPPDFGEHNYHNERSQIADVRTLHN